MCCRRVRGPERKPFSRKLLIRPEVTAVQPAPLDDERAPDAALWRVVGRDLPGAHCYRLRRNAALLVDLDRVVDRLGTTSRPDAG